MNRWLCVALCLMLAMFSLSACDRRSELPEESETGSVPEESSPVGLSGALDMETSISTAGSIPESYVQGDKTVSEDAQPVIADELLDEAQSAGDFDTEQAKEDSPFATLKPQTDVSSETKEQDEDSPFATPTPQPNAAVSGYSDISAPGLGFSFSYPTDWVNIPGRSTVCYVQPLENGTVYPARVAVTMKRMPHKTNVDEVKTELLSYVRKLMEQYDSETFEVETKLDETTQFMGKDALSTTYLAYDGNQEIQGYVITTFFDRYMYVYHFLCAYDDYEAFYDSMCHMRDSVQIDTSVAPE